MPSIAFPPDDTTGNFRAPTSRTDHGQPTTDPARAARNRLNARHSTGPRTPAGKRRSAQNARTHGLTAATPPPALLSDPTYRQAKQELVDELRPTTPMQQVLVSQLAHLTWQLDQIPKLEHQILCAPLPRRVGSAHRDALDTDTDTDATPPPDPNTLTALHLLQNQPTPLTRLWDHHRRLLTRTQSLLRQLLHLQHHERTRADADAALEARLDRNQRAELLNAAEIANRPAHCRARDAADAPPSEISNLKSELTPSPETRQTTPPPAPAQNEPTPLPSPRSVSSVSSVAEHPLLEAQPDPTPRNTAQQSHPPAQNEPNMDNPPRLAENTPPPPMNSFKPFAVVLLATLTLLAPSPRAQQPAVAPPAPAAPKKNLYLDYKERWVTPPRVANDLLAHKTYHSAAMNTDVGYHVYLPPGYADAKNAQTRYPVIYWLHGLNQSESSNWYPPKDLDAAVRTGEVPPVIVIFASGGGRTFYVDSPDGKLLSETTVIKELIPHVDATYRTIAAREGRAIQGMSMGGWGALRLAMTYPDLFSSVVAFAPSLRQPDNLAATYPDVLNRMFGGDEKRFWDKHPLHLAQANAEKIRGHLPIAFYCGLADDLLPGNQNLHKLLTDLKIDHTYIEVEKANHSMQPLVAALKHSNLVFAAKHFAQPQPAGAAAQ